MSFRLLPSPRSFQVCSYSSHLENDMEPGKEVIAWRVKTAQWNTALLSQSRASPLSALDTSMVAGGETIDIAPENDEASVSARAAR